MAWPGDSAAGTTLSRDCVCEGRVALRTLRIASSGGCSARASESAQEALRYANHRPSNTTTSLYHSTSRPPLTSYAASSAVRAQQAQTQSWPREPRHRKSLTATRLVCGDHHARHPQPGTLLTIHDLQLSSPSRTAPTASLLRASSARMAQRPSSSSSTRLVSLTPTSSSTTIH